MARNRQYIFVRSVSINTDNLLEVELATFSPTVSATGQSLSWDQPATQFSVSVDNPTDFTSRYINEVGGIATVSGVHSTLSDYTAGTKSQTPAGGVDWTQTFSTNATATIVSNGGGLQVVVQVQILYLMMIMEMAGQLNLQLVTTGKMLVHLEFC